MNNNENRIEELEAQVAKLTALVKQLAPALGSDTMATTNAAGDDIISTEAEAEVVPTSSRRGMLKLAGAAAVGATAIAVGGHVTPVAAANGGNFILGQSNSATADTSLIGKMYTLVASDSTADFVTGFSGSLVGWDTSNSATGLRAGVIGYSGPFIFGGGDTPNGVLGIVRSNTGVGSGLYGRSESDVIGASAGLRASSDNGPAVQMDAIFASAPTTGTWRAGALNPDTAGNLWYCVAGGTPGTWRKIAGTATAGAFHALTPGRVYDSRATAPTPGLLASGANRTVSVADRRDTGNGSVAQANFVPAGATAVSANITVTDTVGAGYLAINPGGNTTVNASAINWSGPNQNLANGLTLTLNANREISVIGGGGGSTNFIIDILGYYL
ncbi:MAG: hypothetical protein JWN99_194 [Ilumatobacteraceae bacterium]|nr:hypothetical protein [Ilumatobacteraceae bacterium]